MGAPDAVQGGALMTCAASIADGTAGNAPKMALRAGSGNSADQAAFKRATSTWYWSAFAGSRGCC